MGKKGKKKTGLPRGLDVGGKGEKGTSGTKEVSGGGRTYRAVREVGLFCLPPGEEEKWREGPTIHC